MARKLLLNIGKSLLRIGAGVGVVLAIAWLVLTQPTCAQQPPAAVAANADALQAHVVKLAVDFYPRRHDRLDNLNACADYIAEHFEEAGGRVVEQRFTAQGMEFRNVSAFFGPPDQPRWIVGAHYDSHEDTPGADDNASGVAGLLELARLLGENPPSFAVELVSYPLEEPPAFRSKDMGSAHHARSLDLVNAPVRGVLVFEMIGYYTDEPDSQGFPMPLLAAIYPDTGNFIAVIGNWEQRPFIKQVKEAMTGATPLNVESLGAPTSVPGVDFSDHRNYWPLGLPAVMISDTAFYRNHHYHETTDTPDTLDYERMAHAVTATYVALGVLSTNQDEEPVSE